MKLKDFTTLVELRKQYRDAVAEYGSLEVLELTKIQHETFMSLLPDFQKKEAQKGSFSGLTIKVV